ncbi:DUF4920 domain-containing protein [Aureibaculum sp. A20]|uniref:DUF4920 domain-containing protein n=1 Tax=Aureibaculum flavum TaxID=2795986 RepID=A0ABS0WN51_9FLAO|nr:DUF4920 domain-containing protein [Aureibaculum flavum]MBJ2173402.1 DUF4920 domain-containing protein [Aureibaculum flavum]
MRKLVLLTCFLAMVACKEEKKEGEDKVQAKIEYASFGEKITDENVISKEEMATKFENLKAGDTVAVKFASNINEVCKAKGCWMKLDLGDAKESMVRFKDYGFFVPLDADKKDVIVNGRAYVTETSVEELQHFAKDAGKTEEEIAKITEPKFTYAFEADGVLLKP